MKLKNETRVKLTLLYCRKWLQDNKKKRNHPVNNWNMKKKKLGSEANYWTSRTFYVLHLLIHLSIISRHTYTKKTTLTDDWYSNGTKERRSQHLGSKGETDHFFSFTLEEKQRMGEAHCHLCSIGKHSLFHLGKVGCGKHSDPSANSLTLAALPPPTKRRRRVANNRHILLVKAKCQRKLKARK